MLLISSTLSTSSFPSPPYHFFTNMFLNLFLRGKFSLILFLSSASFFPFFIHGKTFWKFFPKVLHLTSLIRSVHPSYQSQWLFFPVSSRTHWQAAVTTLFHLYFSVASDSVYHFLLRGAFSSLGFRNIMFSWLSYYLTAFHGYSSDVLHGFVSVLAYSGTLCPSYFSVCILSCLRRQR